MFEAVRITNRIKVTCPTDRKIDYERLLYTSGTPTDLQGVVCSKISATKYEEKGVRRFWEGSRELDQGSKLGMRGLKDSAKLATPVNP